jgi:E3 ubiquitin-protein ligase TRIP12
MDEDNWLDEPETSRSRYMGDESHDDEHMGDSGHDDDDDDEAHSDEDAQPDHSMSELARHARESGLLDEATAAAIFGGGGFRAFGGMMSGLSNRFKRLKTELRSKSTTTRLSALRECSELLLVSNEDTLGGAFSTHTFATEFIAILKGQPNIDESSEDVKPQIHDDMDEDAQLAAALAMSTGGILPAGFGGDDDEQECQLVACRCIAHLLEALPGSSSTLIHLGVVPVLCSKLNEIAYIELAEQTLSVRASP